jgi:DNA-binding NtrC family response regulator
MGVPAVRRELGMLTRGQILEQRASEFRANFGSPFFGELRRILTKKETRQAHIPTARGERETILVVEDEPATLRISRILLETWGYRVVGAQTAREAAAQFHLHRKEIRLLLTDIGLPDGNGLDLARRLRQVDPELKVVYFSGRPPAEFEEIEQDFLAKPFNPEGLARKIRETLDQPRGTLAGRPEAEFAPGAEVLRGEND